MNTAREKAQNFTIILLTVILIFVGMWLENSALLLITLFALMTKDIGTWFIDSRIWLSIRSRLYKKQVTAFVEWLNENADGLSDGMDFTDAPPLPDDLRDYWMRIGSIMQFNRLLERSQAEQEAAERKKKNKRGNRGSS